MTDDIVEWLRNSSSDEWCSGQLLKAAAEITRLRAENEKLRRENREWHDLVACTGKGREAYEVIRAENEKLREALRPFAEEAERLSRRHPPYYDAEEFDVEYRHLRAARAALEGK